MGVMKEGDSGDSGNCCGGECESHVEMYFLIIILGALMRDYVGLVATKS